MKILFLSFYSGLIDRGVETFVRQLSKRLAKNHQVLVVQAGPILRCSLKSTPGVDVSRHLRNFEVKRVRISMKWPEIDSERWARGLMIDYCYRKIFLFTLKSFPVIAEFKPNVIIPVNGGWQTLLIKLYTSFSSSKMIISGQAGLGRDDKWNLLLKPDVFVALSKRNAQWTKRFSRKVRIEMIPNGVNLKRFTLRSNLCTLAEVGPLQQPIILCVAGHEKFKRVKETIKAVNLLKKGSLLVVGGSPKTKILGKKILKNRFSQLKFPHEQMPSVYQNADLFTLVSESSEAFGISYLEAMACGLPVVATDDSLRREIISKAGLFIKNPENSKIYARKLKQALKKKWDNLPRKQAQKFSWDMVAEKYEKLLKTL